VKFPRGEYIFCELPDGTIGGFPSWIADVAKSSDFILGKPLTSVAALAELHTLLDSLHSKSQCATSSLHEVRQESTNESENTSDDADESAVL
jgi:hypothetical protein